MPRRIRIFLKDGIVHDSAITLPWLDWMAQVILWRGIVFDHGWIPMDMIKLIAPLNMEGQPVDIGGNVVPFKREGK